MGLVELMAEADRQLTICNACRYCEGYCAVFPALERRSILMDGDVAYLANLCHDCRACYYACMYAPPHEFGVNVPEVLAEVRVETYRAYGWPAIMSRLLRMGMTSTVLASLAAGIAVLGLILAFGPPHRLIEAHPGPGAFYRIVPYAAMAVPFLLLSAYAGAAMVASGLRFWRATGARLPDLLDAGALLTAARESLGLEYLRGGGEGCYYPSEQPSGSRRLLHSLVVSGFASAFAATVAAAVMQDLLGLQPPYPLWSPPVVLGTLGGVALIAGTTGLLLLKWRSDPRPASARMVSADYSFLAALDLVSVTGMLTLALRSTPALGAILVIHLGALVALFLTMPYGKFVHFVYRYAALVRNRVEIRRDAPATGR
jgi:citrate/tricarballylate utilization protein